MTTSRSLIVGRPEGTSAPAALAPLPPAPATPTSSPVTVEQLFALMGQFQASISEIARAVHHPGVYPRPDPDPPHIRPATQPVSPLLPSGPTWSTTPSIPPPPGFTPPSTLGHPYPPSILISNPSTSQNPNLPHNTTTTYNPTPSLPHNPNSLNPIPPNPPHPTHHGPPNPTHLPTDWTPAATSQYGAPLIKQSSWDIPTATMHPDQHRPRTASCWDHPDSRPHPTTSQPDPRRYIKMDPPRFDGTDAPNWIARVQYYFDHLQLPVDHRLHYAVMLFDPPAAEWIFNFRANNTFVQWHDFLEDVRRRFDPLYFQDFTGLIAKLTQTGTLADYNARFESMLTRVQDMSESTRLSIYVEGLQQPVRTQVRHQHPSSVAGAMALAVEFAGASDRQPSSSPFGRRS